MYLLQRRYFGCGHTRKKTRNKALFPVRSTLVKFPRAILSSVVGDHMRNYGAAIFLFFNVFVLGTYHVFHRPTRKIFMLQPILNREVRCYMQFSVRETSLISVRDIMKKKCRTESQIRGIL